MVIVGKKYCVEWIVVEKEEWIYNIEKLYDNDKIGN